MNRVSLTVPAKTEFLVTARLTAASAAGQFGFDMSDIDDVKTACSEACLLLLLSAKPTDSIKIQLCFEDSGDLRMYVSAPHTGTERKNTPESEFGAFMLEALMDEVKFAVEDGMGVYSLLKSPCKA